MMIYGHPTTTKSGEVRQQKQEEWWGMVLKCYTEGFLDCPAIGVNPDYPFEWWVPTHEQIEKFRTDENVKSIYAKSCYEAGEDPGSALDSMD